MATPLSWLLAAQPKLVTPMLPVVHRVITQHLLGQVALQATVGGEPVSLSVGLRWAESAPSNMSAVFTSQQGKARQGIEFSGFNALAQKLLNWL